MFKQSRGGGISVSRWNGLSPVRSSCSSARHKNWCVALFLSFFLTSIYTFTCTRARLCVFCRVFHVRVICFDNVCSRLSEQRIHRLHLPFSYPFLLSFYFFFFCFNFSTSRSDFNRTRFDGERIIKSTTVCSKQLASGQR